MINYTKYNLVNDLGFVKTGVDNYSNIKKYFSTGSIKKNIFTPEGGYSYKSRPSRANREVFEGDVLQARMQNTNKILLVDKNLHGNLFSTGFFQFRPPKELVIPKYLYYFLSSDLFLKRKDELCGGSTQKAINDKNLKKIDIYLPPLIEQQRLVAKLDTLFTEIDSAAEAAELNRAQVDKMELGLIKATFERFSKELKYVRLDELCTKITDGVHKKPVYQDSGVPFLKINNLTQGEGISFENISYISETDHAQFIKRTHPEKGDILITKDGTIGVVRQIETDREFSIFVSLALVKPKNKNNSNYLSHVLRSAYCQSQLNPSGAALKHIYLKDLRKLLIPISSEAINNEIGNGLDDVDEQIRLLRASLKSKTKQLMTLKLAILTQELQPSEAA